MPTKRLNRKQLNEVVNKMVKEFNDKTGLNMNADSVLSFAISAVNTDANRGDFSAYVDMGMPDYPAKMAAKTDEKIEDIYKTMYKSVLENTLMEGKKRILNPQNRPVPKKKNNKNYKTEMKDFRKLVNNDRVSFQNKTRYASEEFDALMTNLYYKAFAPLVKKPVYPDYGGLTQDEFDRLTKATHTDELKYLENTEKLFGTASENASMRTENLGKFVDDFNKTFYNSYEKKNGKKLDFAYTKNNFKLNDAAYIDEPTDEEETAGKIALSYMSLKKQHDSRNFISQFFHGKENRVLSGMRNMLRTMLGNPHYTNNELEDLMKASLAKQANSKFCNLELTASSITNPNRDQYHDSYENYQKIAETAIEANKPVEVEVEKDNKAEKNNDFVKEEMVKENQIDNLAK